MHVIIYTQAHSSAPRQKRKVHEQPTKGITAFVRHALCCKVWSTPMGQKWVLLLPPRATSRHLSTPRSTFSTFSAVYSQPSGSNLCVSASYSSLHSAFFFPGVFVANDRYGQRSARFARFSAADSRRVLTRSVRRSFSSTVVVWL